MTTHQQAAVLSPEAMVEEFKKNGVTHIVTIPDSETNYLYELMMEQPWLEVIPSAREGETFAIALGADHRREEAGVPDSEHGDAGIRRFDPGHGAGLRLPDGVRGGVPGVDETRRNLGFGGALHGAVPECHADQLLPAGGRHRQPADFDGLRGGTEDAATGVRLGGGRISRVQPIRIGSYLKT